MLNKIKSLFIHEKEEHRKKEIVELHEALTRKCRLCNKVCDIEYMMDFSSTKMIEMHVCDDCCIISELSKHIIN